MDNLDTADRAFLKSGDVVDIVAPSSKCHPSVLDNIKQLIESWELQCHIPDDLFGDSLLYANTDEKRFAHLKHALLNNTSKAIWCLLGGYGATKLIPMLSQIKPPVRPKIFIGFSDSTALHIFLQKEWRWSTIHGPSGYQAALNKVSPDSVSKLKNILFNKDYSLSYNQIVPLNQFAKNHSQICTTIIGGNLHLIQASIGTSWQIKTTNKILFIEEINERAYRIDRALAHLSQAGVFDQVKAILFGDFIDRGEPDGRFLVQETINEFANHCSLPVLQISNVGHGPINNPLLLGNIAKLNMDKRCSLEFI
jgi:muramoyltetrapeptide carboxypeptidase